MRSPVGLLFVAALAACTDAPRRPLDPAAVERDLRARSLRDPGLRDAAGKRLEAPDAPNSHDTPWPPETLDLGVLTLAAWRFRPELEVARANVAAAEAKVTTAGAFPNPKLSGLGGRVDDPTRSPWFFSAALEFTIPTAGKISKREAIANQEVVLARFAAAQTAWRTYAEVRDALLEATLADRGAELAKREATVRATLAAQSDARVAAGAASGPDALAAELEADRARANVAAATAARLSARARLAVACGLPTAELEEAALAAPAPDPAAAAHDVLLDRLDVRVVYEEYEAAERILELELAKQYPDVALAPTWEDDQGLRKYLLGVSVELPLFDHNEGPIAEALAQREAVAARFREREAATLAALDVAHAELAAATTRLAALDPQTRARIAAHHAAAERAVAAGASDRASVTQLEVEALAFDSARLAAEGAHAAALLKLEDALQRPLDPRVARLAPPTPAPAASAHAETAASTAHEGARE
jgi:outer membrane protein TolC